MGGVRGDHMLETAEREPGPYVVEHGYGRRYCENKGKGPVERGMAPAHEQSCGGGTMPGGTHAAADSLHPASMYGSR